MKRERLGGGVEGCVGGGEASTAVEDGDEEEEGGVGEGAERVSISVSMARWEASKEERRRL